MIIRRLVTCILANLLITHQVQAQNSHSCVTTSQLQQLNPRYVGEPLVQFWKAKVLQEVVQVMIEVPETGELLINFVQCNRVAEREERPEATSGRLECDNMESLGDYWLPVSDLGDPSNEISPDYNLEHPAEYFSAKVTEHLETYANDMKWDPTISAGLSSLDHMFLSLVGFTVWAQATYHFRVENPSRWQRVWRRGRQAVGLILLIRQAYAMASGAHSEFVEQRNQRANRIEQLIHQINSRQQMRLDGQDEGQNLEEHDGYSALVNSIARANRDTYEQFCEN